MIYPKIPLAQTIVQSCKRYGIKNIVISPGSRNAPLTLGFTNDAFFSTFSIVDERCAAFFALGMSQQTKEPTVLICTSGSAMLNYFPAVAEAYYSEIPLIVISADRPKHLINIGDGQTINQIDVYGEHVLFSANLKPDIDPRNSEKSSDELPIFKSLENKLERFLGIQEDIQQFNINETTKAISEAKYRRGPVHLNAPFNEPLYETTDKISVDIPIIKNHFAKNIDSEKVKELSEKWNSANKKMVLVGVLDPDEIDSDLLARFIEDSSIICLTETTSNLHHPRIFNAIDKLIYSLNDADFETLKPDLVLTIGGMVVSKRIKKFLREFSPSEHWHLGTTRANNTFFRLTNHIRIAPSEFLSVVMKKSIEKESRYFEKWDSIRKIKNERHNKFMEDAPYSDLSVFDTVLKSLPDNIVLQLSNSSVIRYTQLFNLNPKLEVYCNRGTSGIDGSTSTAIGCSVARNKPTLLITGDLSFFYDSNALWNNHVPSNFKIILINNGGGGIFRIISDENKIKKFSEYFETHHQLTAEQLSIMYGYEYLKSTDSESLKHTLPKFYDDTNGPKILEIFTPRKVNDKILEAYFKYLAFTD